MNQTQSSWDRPSGETPATRRGLTPYVCPRRCADAVDWYLDVFDAIEEGQRYVDPDGRVGRAEIRIGDGKLMLSDEYLDYGAVAPPADNVAATFALHLQVPDADTTVAKAAAAGASVQRAVDEQLVGYRMGTIMDPFGIRWMIATPVGEVSEQQRATEARKFSQDGAPTGPLG